MKRCRWVATPHAAVVILAISAACGKMEPAADPTVRSPMSAECAREPKSRAGALVNTLDRHIQRGDVGCITRVLQEAAFLPVDLELVDYLVRAVDRGQSRTERNPSPGTLPEGAKLPALGYLNNNLPAARDRGFRLEEFGDFVRKEARRNDPATQGQAFALLFNLSTDDDIPLVSEGLDSGNDQVIAIAMFALANRCTPPATEALRKAFKKPAVVDYLRRNEGREAVTKVVKRDCPRGIEEKD